MQRVPTVLFVLLGVAACGKPAPTTATPADAAAPTSEAAPTVVPNVQAQPGDTTTCPYSGRTFVVKADHPKVEYQGNTYTICSEKAAEEVRADPGKYLDDFEG